MLPVVWRRLCLFVVDDVVDLVFIIILTKKKFLVVQKLQK